MKALKKTLALLYPLKKYINQILLLGIMQALFYLAVPFGVQGIVTYTMSGQMSSSLVVLSSMTVVVIVFIGIFQILQMRINETIQQSLLVFVSVKFTDKITKLKPDLYQATFLPSKINQFFEVITLHKGISKILLDFLFSIITIVIGLLILTAYSTFFFVFVVFSAVFFYFLIRKYGQEAMATSMNESNRKYIFVDWLQTLYSDLKSKDPKVNDEYIKTNTNENLIAYIEQKNEHFRILDTMYKGILLFKIFFVAIILFLGIWLVQAGFLNIGQFVASEILVILIINGVEKLVLNLKTIFDLITAVEKLNQVFELDESDEKADNALIDYLTAKSKAVTYQSNYNLRAQRIIYSLLFAIIIILLLPWNQTINCSGTVSTLNPTDRPQTIPSRISGRIERWHVHEGDFVKKNDTIAFISEVKDEYFDPKLLERTKSQVNSKEASILSYEQKINAIDAQIKAINSIMPLKYEQTRNKLEQARVKVISDSADFVSTANNYKITDEQFKRYEDLLAKGIISKTDFENRKAKLQDAYAKKTIAENKWINSKNEQINATIEIGSIRQEYNEKLMKAESEKFSVMSSLYDSEVGLSKMQNQLSNYTIRNTFYYVTAPQDGYVVKSYVQGVGDFVKEGMPLIGFVPNSNNLSVELFIEPMDLPLVYKNMQVQLEFDGWPAFVLSGWPGVSFGTYYAKVVAIDKVISPNGKFRVLASKGKEDWPSTAQVGGGVKGLVLLKTVPIVYEMWRKLNGFPPEFYVPITEEKKAKK